MTIELVMRPQDPPLSWKDFISKTPPFSIAIDGYVNEGPRFDESGPWLNLNHHEGVERLATRSTCGQALMVIRQDLFTRFRDQNGPRAHIFANDCDEDVCVTWFILKNGYIAQNTMNPALNRLVSIEDALDSTAGAYPYPPDMPSLIELAWVFEPYRRFRLSGRLPFRIPEEFTGVVNDVTLRIEKYIVGRGETLPLDTRYERIGGGKNWTMIKEIGAQAYTGMFSDGIRAFVSCRPRSDGRFDYTIGRMSMFIEFPLQTIFSTLNRVENLTAALDRWNGGNTIGGSPRTTGSNLSPEYVERIINETLTK